MNNLIRKSLLYKSGVEYADFCLNHVEGCSHGCRYPCYAFQMKKRCGVVKTYEEWCKPRVYPKELGGRNGLSAIVFGRLNYSRESSSYKNVGEFYNRLALDVIEFCRKNSISYHIKSGTATIPSLT